MSIIELPEEAGLMPSDTKRLPSPSDWNFELIDLYFNEIRKTAERFGHVHGGLAHRQRRPQHPQAVAQPAFGVVERLVHRGRDDRRLGMRRQQLGVVLVPVGIVV